MLPLGWTTDPELTTDLELTTVRNLENPEAFEWPIDVGSSTLSLVEEASEATNSTMIQFPGSFSVKIIQMSLLFTMTRVPNQCSISIGSHEFFSVLV